MGIGLWEWILIFLIILLLFGARRLPEIARALGKALNEFKQARDEIKHTIDTECAPDATDADASEKQTEAKKPPADATDPHP